MYLMYVTILQRDSSRVISFSSVSLLHQIASLLLGYSSRSTDARKAVYQLTLRYAIWKISLMLPDLVSLQAREGTVPYVDIHLKSMSLRFFCPLFGQGIIYIPVFAIIPMMDFIMLPISCRTTSGDLTKDGVWETVYIDEPLCADSEEQRYACIPHLLSGEARAVTSMHDLGKRRRQ